MKRFLQILVILFIGFCTSYTKAVIDIKAPDFTLTDLNGDSISLKDFKGKYVVLEWTNLDCPFVQAHLKAKSIQKLQLYYKNKGVVWLSINSSAPGKQGSITVDEWKKRQAQYGLSPDHTLLDSDGNVGKAYGAKTTPHIFIINPLGIFIYQGAIDDNSSVNIESIKSATRYVDLALEAVLAGRPSPIANTDPYGCSVKY